MRTTYLPSEGFELWIHRPLVSLSPFLWLILIFVATSFVPSTLDLPVLRDWEVPGKGSNCDKDNVSHNSAYTAPFDKTSG